MKTRNNYALRFGLAVVALTLTAPRVAFAEGESSGIDLLIPSVAELIPAGVAFLIIFIVLAKLVWPAVVKMMDEREQTLAADFQAAEAAKDEAAELEKKANEALAEARHEADRIITQAKKEAEEERTRILDDAQAQAAATIEKGRAAIDSERQRAMDELSKSVADLSVEIAGRVIGEDLSDEDHRKLAARFLDEIGSADGE